MERAEVVSERTCVDPKPVEMKVLNKCVELSKDDVQHKACCLIQVRGKNKPGTKTRAPAGHRPIRWRIMSHIPCFEEFFLRYNGRTMTVASRRKLRFAVYAYTKMHKFARQLGTATTHKHK